MVNETTAHSQRASSLCIVHPELTQVPGGTQGVSAAAEVHLVRPNAEGREPVWSRLLRDEGHRVLEFLLGSTDPDL